MPWYNDLRPTSDDNKQSFGQTFPFLDNTERAKIIRNLLRLRKDLASITANKNADQNVLIATWNLKEFGHITKRLPESYFYIAEILSKFDLIAIQEIKTSLKDLQILMRLLGADWSYLVNDITGGSAGNSESFAYIFNNKRVQPTGLAGEIVLWDEISQNLTIKQLMRTPYITGFKAGWKSFAIINIHLKPSNNAPNVAIRKEEITALTDIIEMRLKNKTMWTENLMLMGDFNLYHDNTDIIDVITSKGFLELAHLKGQATNVSGTEAYDKVFYLKNKYFDLVSPTGLNTGGIFKFFDSVFRLDEDWDAYKDQMLAHKEDPSTLVTDDDFKKYFKNHWRIRQISDHLPVWLSMAIDSSDEFLEEKLVENLV